MKNLLLLIFLLVSIAVTAQKNFLFGYIVNKKDDTIHGYINYRGWDINPKKIEFKKTLSTQIQTFTTNELKYFTVDGKEAYKAAVVIKDMAPVTYSNVEEEGLFDNVIDTVFLRVLLKGDKLALYELKDPKFHYYLENANGDIIPLQYKVFYKPLQTGTIITQNIFRDQLKDFTTDPSIIELIQNSSYNKKDLIRVVQKLDPKLSVNITRIEKGKSKNNIRFLLGAGVSSNRIKIVSEPTLIGLDASSSVLNIIAGANFFSPNNLNRFFINALIGYSSFHWLPEYEREATYTYQKEIVRYDLKLNTISTGVILNFSLYNKQAFKIYIGTGAIANFASTPSNEFSVENVASGEKRIIEALVYEKFWIDLPIKSGVNLKNFDISFSRSLKNTFNQGDDHRNRYKLKYSTTSLLIAYQF